MKSYIHDIVRRLLDLHRLEEQMAAHKHDPDKHANAKALTESHRAGIPAGVLIVHDQVRARGKRSVAEVRHGVCSGCHLALGVGNVAALRAGEMRRCGNCGRYVYVVEEDEAPPAKPKKKPALRRPEFASKPVSLSAGSTLLREPRNARTLLREGKPTSAAGAAGPSAGL